MPCASYKSCGVRHVVLLYTLVALAAPLPYVRGRTLFSYSSLCGTFLRTVRLAFAYGTWYSTLLDRLVMSPTCRVCTSARPRRAYSLQRHRDTALRETESVYICRVVCRVGRVVVCIQQRAVLSSKNVCARAVPSRAVPAARQLASRLSLVRLSRPRNRRLSLVAFIE
jgi:hypothetical protein